MNSKTTSCTVRFAASASTSLRSGFSMHKGKASYLMAMKNCASHSSSEALRQSSATTVGSAKPHSILESLPEPIAAEVRRERRAEIFPSQMWSEHYPDEGKYARGLSAVDRLTELRTIGPAAEMLGVMLVNTFEAYVECQRRAMIHSDDARLFAIHSAYAERLIKLYLLQVAALDKHQMRGKQQISVEHVHVAAGGRAIVGQVDLHPARRKTRKHKSSAMPARD